MTRKGIARFLTAVLVVFAASPLFAPIAQAAPDCRGANIIRCTGDRIHCLTNETLPPSQCL